MPNHPIIGKFGIGNLSIEARLDPCRVSLLERFRQRRCRARKRIERAPNFPCSLAIPYTLMRMAAFEHVRRLGEVYDHLTADELKPGFVFNGERIPFINP